MVLKKTLQINLFFVVLSTLLTPLVFAGTPSEIYAEGSNHFLGQNGYTVDQLKGVQLIEQSANQGSLDAQKFLGGLYLWGDHAPTFPIDLDQAIRYLTMAANQGDAESMAFLGNAYAKKTDGSMQNAFEAFKWNLKAAEKGFERVYAKVAENYFYGQGVQINESEAAKWLRKAAEFGDVWSQYLLGHMLKEGTGVEKNAREAMMWLEKAAAQGSDSAQLQLGLAYRSGLDGILPDENKSIQLLEASANGGNETAQMLLGQIYTLENREPDYEKSFKYYKMAADQGNAEALLEAGKFYLNGHFVEKDEQKGKQLIEEAVAKGNSNARALLAALHEQENVGNQETSYQSAKEMLIAAHQGSAYAQHHMGLKYLYGDGQEKNEGQAFLWFEKAAQQGFAMSEREAGKMLYEGIGVPMDKVRGLQYIQKAASHGDAPAILFLKSKGLSVPQPTAEKLQSPSKNSALNTDNWGSL